MCVQKIFPYSQGGLIAQNKADQLLTIPFM